MSHDPILLAKAKFATKRAARPPVSMQKLSTNHGWESGRRLSVGRSSSVLLGSVLVGCFLDCSVLVRRVGLPGALSWTFRENIMLRSRDLSEANSEVVTMYSCLAGRMRAISLWEASIRSGVGGCVEKT